MSWLVCWLHSHALRAETTSFGRARVSRVPIETLRASGPSPWA